MRYLIDTHIVLWWYFDSSRLNREHLRIIADGKNDICVSAAAIWEIEVKRRNGKNPVQIVGESWCFGRKNRLE